VPCRGENHFKPRPQNRIAVPLRDLFHISNEHPVLLKIGVPPWAFSLYISHYHFVINCQELLGGYEESEFEDFFSGLWSTFKDKYLHKQVCMDSL